MTGKIGPRPVEFESEFQEGKSAYKNGVLVCGNPYDSRTLEAHYWRMGWFAAQGEQENATKSTEAS